MDTYIKKTLATIIPLIAVGLVLFGLLNHGVNKPALGGLDADKVFIAKITSTFGRGMAITPHYVWTSATNGYVFWINASGGISYGSTTDTGATWATTTADIDSVNTTDAINVSVWYDRWTKGNTGNLIHIATIDTGVDDTYYTQFDTSTNTWSTTVLGTTQSASCTSNSDCWISITEAENGVLYMTAKDGSDSWVVACSSTCTNTANWAEKTSAYTSDNGDDPVIIMPLVGTNNVITVFHDVSASTIDYNVYSATSSSWWHANPINVVTSIEDNSLDKNLRATTLAGTYSTSTNKMYFIWGDGMDDTTTADQDVDVWEYDSSALTWTQLTSATTSALVGHAGIAYDPRNTKLHIVFSTYPSAGTNETFYLTSSSDDGSTWVASDTPQFIGDITANPQETEFGIDGFSARILSLVVHVRNGTNADKWYFNKVMTYPNPAGGGGGSSPEPVKQSLIWYE